MQTASCPDIVPCQDTVENGSILTTAAHVFGAVGQKLSVEVPLTRFCRLVPVEL